MKIIKFQKLKKKNNEIANESEENIFIKIKKYRSKV